ncbi:MAG: hypothetical protein EBX40_08265, partial [Gammaproteobacteria bacterium]|nr:hypothetical protein [Gammaproteobacteria bacterium]
LIMPSGWAIGSSAACAAARVPAYSGREWPWAWQEYRINRALSLAPPELQKFINYKSAEYQTKNSVPKMKIGAFGVYFEFEKPTGKNILILFNNAGLALSFYFILDLGIKQLGINDFPGLAWFIKIDLIGSLLAMNICGRQANLIQQIEGDVSSLLAYWSSLNNRNLPLDNEARYATIRKEREELVGCCNPKPPRIEGLFDDLPFLKVLFGITFFVSLTNQWIGTWFQNFVGMASTLTDLGKSDDSEAFSITWSAISVLVSVILAQIATELLMSYKFFNAEMELRGQIIHLYAFLNKLVCNEVDTEALIARLPTNQARKNKSDRHARHKDQISLVIEPAASDINTEFSINSSAPAEDADMAEKRTEWSMCLQKWCCGTTATKKHNRLNAQASSQSALTLV